MCRIILAWLDERQPICSGRFAQKLERSDCDDPAQAQCHQTHLLPAALRWWYEARPRNSFDMRSVMQAMMLYAHDRTTGLLRHCFGYRYLVGDGTRETRCAISGRNNDVVAIDIGPCKMKILPLLSP